MEDSLSTLKFAQKAKRLKARIEPDLRPQTSKETLAHYKKELDYYKAILQLKSQASDSKSTFIYRIKQLETDKSRLLVEDSLQRRALETLKLENAVIKKELEIYRSKADENESRVDSSPKKSVADGSEDLEHRKTLQFKSKFRSPDTSSQGLASRREPTRIEHLIRIFDGKGPSMRMHGSVEPQRERLERSTSLKNISLVEMPSTTGNQHKRSTSESIPEGITVHGNPNTMVEIGLKVLKRPVVPTEDISLPVPKTDLEEEIALSRGSTPESRKNREHKTKLESTFYQNYLRLGQRIKELNNEIESSKLPPLLGSPRKSWLPQPLKSSTSSRGPIVFKKDRQSFLTSDDGLLWPKTTSKRRPHEAFLQMKSPGLRQELESIINPGRGSIVREYTVAPSEIVSPYPFPPGSKSVGIGRTDPLKKRLLEPVISEGDRPVHSKFSTPSEALLEYEKFKKSLLERSRSSFRSHAKLEQRRPLESSRVARLKKTYRVDS